MSPILGPVLEKNWANRSGLATHLCVGTGWKAYLVFNAVAVTAPPVAPPRLQSALAIVLAARRVAIAIVVAVKSERDAIAAVPEVAMTPITGPKPKAVACTGARAAIAAKASGLAHGMATG